MARRYFAVEPWHRSAGSLLTEVFRNARLPISRRSWWRLRESRERTVPTGTLMTFATCLQAASRERLQTRGLSLTMAGDIVKMTAVDDSANATETAP